MYEDMFPDFPVFISRMAKDQTPAHEQDIVLVEMVTGSLWSKRKDEYTWARRHREQLTIVYMRSFMDVVYIS